MSVDLDINDYSMFLSKGLSTLIILSMLYSEKELSGYSLIKKIKERTNGLISMKAGTIYPQMENLERQGIIIKEEKQQLRTVYSFYKLNSEGMKFLTLLWEEWRKMNLLIEQIFPFNFEREKNE